MTALIIGLLLFLGIHSVRLVSDRFRSARIASMGEGGWKGLFSIVSAIGLVLIVWGYGNARTAPVDLWSPPIWTRHLAALLVLIAFVLIAAAYVPRNHLKASLGHPMLAGVKAWALAHLLANGRLADVLLFGGFLAWSIVAFARSRRRDRANGVSYPAGTVSGDVKTALAGVIAWVVFAFWLHGWLIGVQPLG